MVDNCCVAVVDGIRARFLTLEQAASPGQTSPFLLECKDLVNPESDARGRDLWSDVKSGRGHEHSGASAHGYDDHRDEHEDEFKRRFAVRIVDELLALARSRGAVRVIVAAERQMLGFLRPVLASASKSDFVVSEVAKDLSKLSAAEIQERLAREDLVPPRLRATGRRA